MAAVDKFRPKAEDIVTVLPDAVRAATEEVFSHSGLTADAAKSCADVLITNDLRGVESHGVSNMLRQYASRYSSGQYNATPDIRVVRETSTTANIDADHANGIHVGPIAMQMAIDKAKEHGMGAVNVINAGHLGGAGYHASMAAEQGCVGHVMATSEGPPMMIPTGAREPKFGTNPIAWAAPSGTSGEAPFLFDVAVSNVAGNKIGLAKRVGLDIEEGWLADADGAVMPPGPAPDPAGMRKDYFLLPFGGAKGSHKGYGIAAVIDILCNALSGAGPAWRNADSAQFYMAIDIDAFIDRDDSFSVLEDPAVDLSEPLLLLSADDELIDEFLVGLRTAQPAVGKDRVLYPGLSEAEETAQRSANGIPYHKEVVGWFRKYGEDNGLPACATLGDGSKL